MLKQLSLFDAVAETPKVEKETAVNNGVDISKLSKHYYTIGEIADLFNVNSSLLRFWEKEFPTVLGNLKKNKKGDRFYSKQDIEKLKTLFHLIKIRKMTLEGAREYLKDNRKKGKDDKTLVENLQKIKEFLVALKKDLQ